MLRQLARVLLSPTVESLWIDVRWARSAGMGDTSSPKEVAAGSAGRIKNTKAPLAGRARGLRTAAHYPSQHRWRGATRRSGACAPVQAPRMVKKPLSNMVNVHVRPASLLGARRIAHRKGHEGRKPRKSGSATAATPPNARMPGPDAGQRGHRAGLTRIGRFAARLARRFPAHQRHSKNI